jgi:hypothetical protein
MYPFCNWKEELTDQIKNAFRQLRYLSINTNIIIKLEQNKIPEGTIRKLDDNKLGANITDITNYTYSIPKKSDEIINYVYITSKTNNYLNYKLSVYDVSTLISIIPPNPSESTIYLNGLYTFKNNTIIYITDDKKVKLVEVPN